ncbi:hypothetical protein GUITHDRAFT_162548 [Guillardia theta CCMP2712]|uniref:Uncharacterized protein n=1 Tax=Guillardia theta (strain CCMP2712) TaxID=905079 RepID=L1JI34_GUITC|nr:hypothetical protein GUITHDRAFT_162548 [Guillardia theta CCMP2712]EKX48161.1 hypothetical protein GUITHDRAFT_162548 [Guillardia theta CCMP2712]|mmetsp:Transcript_28642/g.92388  ORF Transcript_28642/g.92388 Transcript_28642/m.92388 type:complete len:365 (-) Transcript_28642:141-1235(-)|eukprot:XP_005835141.1 hypothetical protein GUITHDRAFT_162548 [Guillardia theta CCMP2712]
MARARAGMAAAVGGGAALVLGMLVAFSWRGRETVLGERLWSPRGYGYRPQYYGEPYPLWEDGMTPIYPDSYSVQREYARSLLPYALQQGWAQEQYRRKVEEKRAERDLYAYILERQRSSWRRQRELWLATHGYYMPEEARYSRFDPVADVMDTFSYYPPSMYYFKDSKPSASLKSKPAKNDPVTKQQLFSVKDLNEDSYAEALEDPSHPSGPWGVWVDPGSKAKKSNRHDTGHDIDLGLPHLSNSKGARKQPSGSTSAAVDLGLPALTASGQRRNSAKHSSSGAVDLGFPAPSHSQGKKDQKAGNFVGSLKESMTGGESEAEALMDPSHPSGPWGTWVQPSSSSAVQTSTPNFAMHSLLDSNDA